MVGIGGSAGGMGRARDRPVAPMVKGVPGNAGAVFLIDRGAGTALTLTLWDSEEAALASDQAAERSREATVAAAGVELTGRGRYEVVARS